MPRVEVATVNTPQMRHAGKELLSLALMDARNQSLRWAAAFDAAPSGARPLLHDLGRLGWFQEYWIARNLQRQRGASGEPRRPSLASILPDADAMFEVPGGEPPRLELQTIRQYLADTLETTLELLEGSPEDDDALYFYRLALFREDACAEQFAVLAHSLGLETGLAPLPEPRAVRPPLDLPATRVALGSPRGGFVPDPEHWLHDTTLPEFEIDSQAVTWAQFGEFVEDGGYDDRRHWSDSGWAWVQAEARRTPRHVEQIRHGVLQRRFGRLVRAASSQAAVHVSWFEADAWCRWAGRRLPAEAEWEAAALQAASRGFRWGQVHEWMAGTPRPYPGADGPSLGQSGDVPPAGTGTLRVLRGASFATPGRLCTPKARGAALPHDDRGFFGFRSCAA